jgi:hypothetical protein
VPFKYATASEKKIVKNLYISKCIKKTCPDGNFGFKEKEMSGEKTV